MDVGDVDPITSDPAPVDWDFPPAIATVTLNSHGDNVNGILYISPGPGPHPAVVLLHGYPGDEKNLDLAQAIRRVGWNVLFFHYRGAWGSAGSFSIDHALEDVSVALNFLRSPESLQQYRMDGNRIALVGHSMGAYLALLAASQLPSIRLIAALAPVNTGHMIAANPPGRRAAIAQVFEDMGHGAIKAASFVDQFTKMADNPSQYDLLERITGLDGKSVLLVGASRDEDVPLVWHFDPLVQSIKERNKARLTSALLDADHVFSNARIALARLIAQWLADG